MWYEWNDVEASFIGLLATEGVHKAYVVYEIDMYLQKLAYRYLQ